MIVAPIVVVALLAAPSLAAPIHQHQARSLLSFVKPSVIEDAAKDTSGAVSKLFTKVSPSAETAASSMSKDASSHVHNADVTQSQLQQVVNLAKSKGNSDAAKAAKTGLADWKSAMTKAAKDTSDPEAAAKAQTALKTLKTVQPDSTLKKVAPVAAAAGAAAVIGGVVGDKLSGSGSSTAASTDASTGTAASTTDASAASTDAASTDATTDASSSSDAAASSSSSDDDEVAQFIQENQSYLDCLDYSDAQSLDTQLLQGGVTQDQVNQINAAIPSYVAQQNGQSWTAPASCSSTAASSKRSLADLD